MTREVRRLEGLPKSRSCYAMSSDAAHLFVGTSDGGVWKLESATGTVTQFAMVHEVDIRSGEVIYSTKVPGGYE